MIYRVEIDDKADAVTTGNKLGIFLRNVLYKDYPEKAKDCARAALAAQETYTEPKERDRWDLM